MSPVVRKKRKASADDGKEKRRGKKLARSTLGVEFWRYCRFDQRSQKWGNLYAAGQHLAVVHIQGIRSRRHSCYMVVARSKARSGEFIRGIWEVVEVRPIPTISVGAK